MADSNTEEIDQLRWKAIEVETLQISWALMEPTSGLDAPAAWMTSRRKKETTFLDIAREGRRGDTNRRWRKGDND